MNLTPGAISKITSGVANSAELKPTLQVTELKLVQTKQQSDRFRLVLSDGSHLQQAMLATQINHLVRDGNLRTGSVVQLIHYTCTTVQGRMIIIILELEVIAVECETIGNPVLVQRSSGTSPSLGDPPGKVNASTQSFNSSTLNGGMNANHNPAPAQNHVINQSHNTSPSSYHSPGRYAVSNPPSLYPKVEAPAGSPGSVRPSGLYVNQNASIHNPKPEIPQPPMGNYSRPPQSAYQQPPPMYSNRGPIVRNEAAPRIMPITALNPYQGRWTIKARVTAKGELRHYNNTRGDGKVFSFDLLDSDGGEIRSTCFNAVADQFYHQIEAGRVYLISKGSLRPAQKNFNHLHNDLEIFLESTSTILPCFEDDSSIPRQQFHFRKIIDIEDMENNSVVDIIGVVSSIAPTASLMRKNGTETQKRTLQLKDMSGRSVELTLWGNFCNSEGQKLQDICDSGDFPVLAVKSGRVNDFNGKAVGTISTSQLFIDPDFPEAHTLKEWFDREGRSTPSVSISREMSNVGRLDVMKTISQIKDERLGTSEKPDWITVPATVIYIKSDNFCYTACPIMAGDRPCNKKVTNNGDGTWHCEKCDKSIGECDYRYIIQFQIQDHTGITWATAFQECGEQIMGISAKDLHNLKHEQQDDEGFSKVLRQVLFSRYLFKLKVKEETFSDEQRVKSTVVKSERTDHSSQSRLLLDMMEKLNAGNSTSLSKVESGYPNTGVNNAGIRNFGSRHGGLVGTNSVGSISYAGNAGLLANQGGQYGNQNNAKFPMQSSSGAHLSCNSCGVTGHSSANCPSIINAPGQSIDGGYANRASQGVTGGCYKCHQSGHWAKDCPGLRTVPPAYGSSSISPGRMGGFPRQQVGGF